MKTTKITILLLTFLSYCFILKAQNNSLAHTPVCGVNGVTYADAYFADRAGVQIAYDGTCIETNNFCGVTNVHDLDFLEYPVASCLYKHIYSFVIDDTEYIYVRLAGYCEFSDGSFLSIIDLSSYLLDCQGNLICATFGYNPGPYCLDFDNYPDNYDFSNYYDLNIYPHLIPENLVWQENPDCLCPIEENPVCGVDGFTYYNACYAACEGIKIASIGACP